MRAVEAEPMVTIVQPSAADERHAGTRPGASRSVARHLRFLLILVLLAFVLRAIAAILLHEVTIAGGGDGFYFGDDRTYDRIAWEQAQAWHGIGPGVGPQDGYLMGTYVYIEAAIYFVLGHHPLAMKLLNCLLGALTAGLIFLMARSIFGHLASVFAGTAAAFFPSTFLWSLMNLKDTMFIFAVALLLWLITLLLATGRWPLILPLLAAFALVGGVRTYVQAMFTLLIPGTVLLQNSVRLPRKWGLAAVLLVGCAALLWVSGGVRWFGVPVDQVNRVRYCMAVGADSAFVASAEEAAEECVAPESEEGQMVVGRSLWEIAAWMPTGMAYALAAPFPWTADRAIEQAIVPEMLVWYAAVALAVIAVVRQWRNWRQYVHLLGYIGGMFLLLSLGQGNEGTLVRHRGMLISFVLVFSGAGAAWLWSRWWVRRPASRSVRVDTLTTHHSSLR